MISNDGAVKMQRCRDQKCVLEKPKKVKDSAK